MPLGVCSSQMRPSSSWLTVRSATSDGVGADVPAGVDALRVRGRHGKRREPSVGELLDEMADDVAVERDDVAAVGQQRDRDACLGDDAQEGRLADGAAVVADDRALGSVEPLEAEAPRRAHQAEVGQVDLTGVHRRRGAGGEHLGAVGGPAVVHVHLGEGQQVAGAHGEHRAGRRVRAGQRPDRGGPVARAGLWFDVADRGPEHDRLVGAGRRVGEAERGEEVLAKARVVRLLAEHLDEPAEHAEAGVVVGELLARGEQLGDLVEDAEVLLDRVVAEARVGEDVALEAGRVAQQLARGDLRRPRSRPGSGTQAGRSGSGRRGRPCPRRPAA